MKAKITISSLVGLISLPGVGLYLLLKRQGPIGFWKMILVGTGIVYLVVIAQAFSSLFFGIVVAHVSFVSTLLWYAVVIGETNSLGQTDRPRDPPVTSDFASICIPIIVFQIVASGSRIFGGMNMDSCGNLMISWLKVVICLSIILLFGRKCYWHELNWFNASLDKKAMEDTTLSYMVMSFVALMIFPFFSLDFPNPILILSCAFR